MLPRQIIVLEMTTTQRIDYRMKMLNCPECGLTITDTQEECPKCRTRINANPEASDNDGIISEAAVPIDEKKKNGKSVKSSKKIKEKMIAAVLEAEANPAEVAPPTPEEEMIAAVVEAEALAAIEEEALAPAEENFCETCMAPVEEGQNFCQLCGANIEAIEEMVNPIIPKSDEDANRGSAAIGYIFFFIPIFIGYYRKSSFAKFHAKQAVILFVFSVILFLGLAILNQIINSFSVANGIEYFLDGENIPWHQGLGTGGIFYHYLTWMIQILHLMPFVFMLLGIFNALRRRKQALPFIGRFANLNRHSFRRFFTK